MYVKCYAKMVDDSVKFYKDGYTDLRGRFNYMSEYTEEIKKVKRISIFINDYKLGCSIKECSHPSYKGKI